MEPEPPDPELTRLLSKLAEGQAGPEAPASLPALHVLVGELRAIARSTLRSQRAWHTLQPTALVNEAYLKLSGGAARAWTDRKHFFATAARAMRQILVDHERARRRDKRGGDGQPVTLHHEAIAGGGSADVDLLDLDAAIAELEALDPRRARVVEMRYFGGLEVAEVAEVLGVSVTTVERDWRAARAWLWRRLNVS